MKNIYQVCITLLAAMTLQLNVLAQEAQSVQYDRDTLIAAARELIESIPYCFLITLDESGHPQARIMDHFQPEENLVIWLGTNPNSRKVKEIKNDSRVTICLEAPNGSGYAVLKGHAGIVNDQDLKNKYWKDEWKQFYPNNTEDYMLIKIVTDILEVVDYRRGIVGDPGTWAVPSVELNISK